MNELLPSLLVVATGIAVVAGLLRGLKMRSSALVWVGYLLHCVASVAQVAITQLWYGGGDLLYYGETGRAFARVLDYDTVRFGWETVLVFTQLGGVVPVDFVGQGTSTGSMCALSGALLFVTGGSLVAACQILSVLGFSSRLLLSRIFMEKVAEARRPLVQGVILLLPSVTFWGAAIAKETVVLAAIGPMLWGAQRVVIAKSASSVLFGLLLAGVAGAVVWLVKPYVVIAFVAAVALWAYLERFGGRSRPRKVHFVFGALVAGGTVFALGEVAPAFSVDVLAEQAARLQAAGSLAAGGSSYELGNTAARGPLEQLAFVPLAMFYSLFRPFIFESRNALMFLNSLETSAIVYVLARVLVLRGWRSVVLSLREVPFLAFCLVFVGVLSAGVGLATSNLGTLTRYRVPMMPFYVGLLAVLLVRHPERHQAVHSAPPRRVRQAATP